MPLLEIEGVAREYGGVHAEINSSRLQPMAIRIITLKPGLRNAFPEDTFRPAPKRRD